MEEKIVKQYRLEAKLVNRKKANTCVAWPRPVHLHQQEEHWSEKEHCFQNNALWSGVGGHTKYSVWLQLCHKVWRESGLRDANNLGNLFHFFWGCFLCHMQLSESDDFDCRTWLHIFILKVCCDKNSAKNLSIMLTKTGGKSANQPYFCQKIKETPKNSMFC